MAARHERRAEVSETVMHFGGYLRREREARGKTLAELSRATKIKESLLELLEEARLGELPAPVFVRGFVAAYARELGIDGEDAIKRYQAHAARFEADRAAQVVPLQPPSPPDDAPAIRSPLAALTGDKRKVGVVMVVLLILVVATLTLSFLLRQGPSGDDRLSALPPAARSV
jgi:cytoskeletal protein RodZ